MAVPKGTDRRNPRANSQKKTHSQPHLPVPSLYDPSIYPPKIGVNFSEAVGKTVAYVNYVVDEGQYHSLTVRFTDGTQLSFELLPQVRVRADYMECLRGDLETIREYGIVDGRSAREDREEPSLR